MIGKGVARRPDGVPVVFNECDERVFPLPTNPATGVRGGRGSDDLSMQHGLATVLAIAGIDPLPHFGVDPILPVLG
jgi:hypothetical protein